VSGGECPEGGKWLATVYDPVDRGTRPPYSAALFHPPLPPIRRLYQAAKRKGKDAIDFFAVSFAAAPPKDFQLRRKSCSHHMKWEMA